MIDPALFYVATFSLAALCLLLVAVIALYLRLSKKYVDAKARLTDDERENLKVREKLLADSHKEALQTISDARKKAIDIVNQAQIFTNAQNEFMKSQIEKTANIYKDQYVKSMDLVKSSTDKTFQNISQDIKGVVSNGITGLDKQIAGEVEAFKSQLTKEVARIQEVLGQVAEEERKKSEAAFTAIRTEKLKELDEKIVEAVNIVSKEFLEKGLSAKEHEEVIFRALEKAKEEGVFK